MQQVIEAAKAEFGRATDRLKKGLSTTPDDKINWSPSPTSRTPIQQVAHAAVSLTGMMDWFKGKPFPYKDMKEFDTALRAMEKDFSTREQVLEVLETNSGIFLTWLDSLTPEQVASTLTTDFGSFPMADAITFPADHIRAHASQLEYIQTIYGDLDWHMGE